MTDHLNEMLDALTQRALDMLDARSWLLHNPPPVLPEVPVIDSDGNPVVMAFVWRVAGVPRFVAEFDAGVRRFRVSDLTDGVWTTVEEPTFLSGLSLAHARGAFTPPDDLGPMDTGGGMEAEGVVGITVTRGDMTIPVDPAVGLASGIVSVGDEAETFLRENTRGAE